MKPEQNKGCFPISCDKRPPNGAWAGGDYTNRCVTCKALFIGDKLALVCADCAYKANPKDEPKARLEGKTRAMKYAHQIADRDHAAIAIAEYILGMIRNCYDNVLRAKLERYDEAQKVLEELLKKEK